MFVRLLGVVIIVCTSYILCVFALPEIADRYGDKDLNAQIRTYKNKTLQFASGSDTPASLFDKITGISVQYVDETKQHIQKLGTTVDKKVMQVHEASLAVENAYSGIVDATQKIQNLTGTGK